MALFYRVIEQSDGRWACQHGSHQFDVHDALHDAIEHVSSLARECASAAEIYLHRLGGLVARIGTVGLDGADAGPEL